MTDIKCVINDGKTGKSYAKTVDSSLFLGRKLGDTLSGGVVGLAGYEMQITGGSDTAGFPMRQELEGGGRKKMLLKAGEVGVHIKRKGSVLRKTVRGSVVNEFTAQVNMKVTKHGTKAVADLLGIEKKEEQHVATPKEEKKTVPEAKKEEKTEAPKAEEKHE